MFVKIIITSLALVSLISQSFAGEYDRYMTALSVLGEPEPKPSVFGVASGFGASSGQIYTAISYSDKDREHKYAYIFLITIEIEQYSLNF